MFPKKDTLYLWLCHRGLNVHLNARIQSSFWCHRDRVSFLFRSFLWLDRYPEKLSTLSTILNFFLRDFCVSPQVVYILSTLYFCKFTPISWNSSPFLTSFLPKISSFAHLSTKLSTLSTKLSTQSIKVLYRSYPQFYPHSPQIWNCIFCCGCAILYSETQDNHQTTDIDYRW